MLHFTFCAEAALRFVSVAVDSFEYGLGGIAITFHFGYQGSSSQTKLTERRGPVVDAPVIVLVALACVGLVAGIGIAIVTHVASGALGTYAYFRSGQ